jgi:hypothetical protein
MKRIILMLTVAAMLVVALAITAPMAFATVGSDCTFKQGTTTCTTVHGSDGSVDSHHGQKDSSGTGTDPTIPSCKVTGPTHTC